MPMTLSLVFEERDEQDNLVKSKSFTLDPETGFDYAVEMAYAGQSHAFSINENEQDEDEPTLNEWLLAYASSIDPTVFDYPATGESSPAWGTDKIRFPIKPPRT